MALALLPQPLLGVVELPRRGASSVERVEACLRQIEARESEVQAWEHLRPRDEILADARAAASRAPLYGLPLAVKDIIDVSGLPTGCGSPIHAGRVAAMDAACIALLRRAGAVILGKAVTTELAYFGPGKTRNPDDPARTPGGSSSGSAAAVAAGMAPVALGTQTASSVIRPASFCGVTGYVPTRGQLPLRGVQPLAPALDALGLLADSLERIRAVRAALLDGARPAPRARRACPRRNVVGRGSGSGRARHGRDLGSRGRAAGRRGKPRRAARMPGRRGGAHGGARGRHGLRGRPSARPGTRDSGAARRRAARPARARRARPYSAHRAALERGAVASEPVLRLLDEVDAVLAPAALGAAPQGLGSTGSPQMNRAWQLLGLPTVTFPAGRSEDGMPLGLQLIGAAHSDDALLELAASAQEISATG